MGEEPLGEADRALLELLDLLREAGYHFVTPTPATHARVLGWRARDRAKTLRDLLGWSMDFSVDLIPARMMQALDRAGMLSERRGLLYSLVRVSTLHGELYLHSAYPTEAEDSVFFGPDSYRFADLVARELKDRPLPAGARLADIGTGAGVGAIIAAKACPGGHVIATDVNPKALRLARINAAAAGAAIELVEASGLDGVDAGLDAVMLNPPYIIDEEDRAYRDGGGMHGGQLSLELSRAAMDRLRAGGRIILYTGSAIVDGEDRLGSALRAEALGRGYTFSYREIDPDVFGEELDKRQYQDVERIAVVSAIITAT